MIRLSSSPKRSHSRLGIVSNAGATSVISINSAATIRDHQRGAPRETSGVTPTSRNAAVNTQPKPRLLDALTSWVLEKSSCVAIGYWSLTLAADHHIQAAVLPAGQQHLQL